MAATPEAADLMKMGDRVGHNPGWTRGDLAILEADPSVDIRATGHVYEVLDNGRLLRTEELTGQLR